MTVDEIKQTYSMRDVVARYGISVGRNSMCCCPFHGEKHPSMKIYPDSYHCFACGESGDIFTWVQKMEKADFKTAFYVLGGSYDKDHRKAKLAQYHAQKALQNKQREEAKRQAEIDRNTVDIHKYRNLMRQCEEGSDEWWDNFAEYTKACQKADMLEGG